MATNRAAVPPDSILGHRHGRPTFNAARTSGTLLGVAGLGAAALIGFRRQTSTETALHDERTKALHERYSTAAEQLVHDSSAIRMAGVYALASLADDWASSGSRRERQVCIDLLCAYLRANKHQNQTTETDVRTAILDSIRRRILGLRYSNGWRKANQWHTSGLNLRKVELHTADLSTSVLAYTDLTDADLTDAHLSGSTFTLILPDRDIFGERLEESMRPRDIAAPPETFRRVSHRATLLGTNFTGADLTDTDLREATPKEVLFTQANLRGADLTLARFDTCDFTGADLSHAKLKGADLTNTTGLEQATTTGIIHDETTSWPTGFTLPSRDENT